MLSQTMLSVDSIVSNSIKAQYDATHRRNLSIDPTDHCWFFAYCRLRTD